MIFLDFTCNGKCVFMTNTWMTAELLNEFHTNWFCFKQIKQFYMEMATMAANCSALKLKNQKFNQKSYIQMKIRLRSQANKYILMSIFCCLLGYFDGINNFDFHYYLMEFCFFFFLLLFTIMCVLIPLIHSKLKLQ